MRVLHITEILAPVGGIETYLLRLLPLLEGIGLENCVVYRQSHPQTVENGLHTIHLPLTNDSVQDENNLAAIIQSVKPTVICLHAVYDLATVRAAGRLSPTLAYVHGFVPVCPGLGKYFRRGDEVCTRSFGLGCVSQIYWRRCASARHPRSVYQIMRNTRHYLDAYQLLDGIIVGSCYMRELLAQNGFVDTHTHILPPHFEQPTRQRVEPNGNPPEILFVGRLEAEKGLPYLLEAVRLLPMPYRLRIAGDGALRDSYVFSAAALGLTDQVEFLGWLNPEDLREAYRRASFLVMTSVMPEPFGKVGIEAMAYGRPVVAFNVGGISDWLHDEENGLMAAPRDSRDLAAKMSVLLQNPAESARLGQNGWEFVRQNFNPEQYGERFSRILETAVSQAN